MPGFSPDRAAPPMPDRTGARGRLRLPMLDGRRPGHVWLGVLVDAALAGLLIGFAASLDFSYLYRPPALMPSQPELPAWLAAVHLGWSVASWAGVSVRRKWPQMVNTALPVLLIIHLAVLPTGYTAFVVTAYTMYHLGRCAPRRWFVPVWALVIVGTLTALTLRSDSLLVDALMGVALTPVALATLGFFWMLGLNGRRRDMELVALRDRAELAAIAERTRIAREMHDIVAHSLTAVIAQADGGRFIAAKHPDKAVEALENIASTARDSLGQMRQLLSVLRDPAELDDVPTPASDTAGDSVSGHGNSAAGSPAASPNARASSSTGVSATAAEYAPMPGLDALPQLISEASRTGLRITFDEVGDRPSVGATTQLTIYRIVQESLTNAVKHAGDVAADVRIDWGKRGSVITVRNEAGPGRDDVEASESEGGRPRIGRGITGMRERVALHGGTLEIDDAPDGFTVTARLPKG